MAWEIAGWYENLGAREEAIAWIDRSIELSHGTTYTFLGAYMIYSYFGEEDKALVYAEKSVEREPKNVWALRALGSRDIESGQVELALDRWQRAYPDLVSNKTLVVDDSNWGEALFFAENLKEAGATEWAMHLATGYLEHYKKWVKESSPRQWEMDDIEPELYATLGWKRETLDAMRRSIVDGHHRMTPIWYTLPAYDFIRDEPEFKELMDVLHSDLAEQLRRVRQMECNGELAPAPGVEFEPVCD
jgi:tetratricopeptide (TPR) repeat protein